MTKISELTAGTTPDGTEKLPVVQSGSTVRLTVQQLAEVPGSTITPVTQTALNLKANLAGPNAITGLYTFAATAGGISVTGTPNPALTNTQLGLTTNWGALANVTAGSATVPEGAGSFNITSAVGAANPSTAFKAGLSGTATSNPGSADMWAQTNVMTLNSAGVRRGAIVYEADLNNFFGNYGTCTSPFAANVYVTGQNWDGTNGGYSDFGVGVLFGQVGRSTNPMWQYGLYFGIAGYKVFNTASIFDETNSPTILKAVGTHTNGIDLSGATISGNAIATPGFSVNGTGTISSASSSATGITPLTMQNDDTSAVVTKFTQLQLSGRDTVNLLKTVGLIRATPNDANWSAGALDFYNRVGDTAVLTMRLTPLGGLSIGTTNDGGLGAILANTSIKSQGATSGIGYATGAGGTVTQATSKATTVPLNTVTGLITMNAAALAAGTIVSFALTDSAIAATDQIMVSHESGGTLGAYTVNGRATGAGTGAIDIRNNTAGSLSEAIVLRFSIIKSVNA